MTAAVQIRGLTKRYGGVPAVDSLALDVPAGGVFGLIGPNGAGKTTTMRAIVTLLEPDAGTVRVLGHDPLTDPRAVRGVVGWMPDFFGLYDGLTCAEYLDFFADAYGLPGPARRRRVADLLELVELTHRADTDVAGLSRGMQQRLGLARALVHGPKLLVLDEPASGLDPRARVDLREILRELARQGTTILISSHILAELAELCDGVGIVEGGRVRAQGSIADIEARAAGTVSIRVRVLGGAEDVARAVGVVVDAGALRHEVVGDTITAAVPGGEDQAAALLSHLVAAGVRVVAFAEEHTNLERLFLSVTERSGS